jgi:hypothetical protein
MKLTKAEHDFLMKLMAQTWAYADRHEDAVERQELAMSIMDKLEENLISNGYADQIGELGD